jgi:hypothetical protein
MKTFYSIYGIHSYSNLTKAIEKAKEIIRSRVIKKGAVLDERWVVSQGKKGGFCVKNLDKDWSKVGNSSSLSVIIVSKILET